ncbi:glycosyltransferase family A protein [Sediminibacter sp. Hel_I_10]|uniref:glycosyltransferase family 2 protein n=1 Tax=Sediminibacter sp. Hel_I_10 TaxID=1392490 RepID=UPI00047AB62E|nr:glycosyltransferase family A protein [Sediminibacter sp. Hel_I_10]
MTFFSVIIPLYNKEREIKSTIDSVLAQSFKDFEIIIVNDGSTDGSEAVIKSINNKKIRYFSQENKGASACRNEAISKATGTHIALLDADDLWSKTYLETINRLIDSYPNENVFATAVTIETLTSTKPSTYSLNNIESGATYLLNYFEASYINTILTSSSTVLHKNVFEQIGNYDTTIKSGQDTDLWIRIGLNYNVVFINKSLVVYRYSKQSLSNRTKNVNHKPRYDAYIDMEDKNLALKKFMDLNRFSMAILSKLANDQTNFKWYEEKIDYSNLNKKQRLLLKQPSILIRLSYTIKSCFESLGIELSVFK